jgi:hypothetical protein
LHGRKSVLARGHDVAFGHEVSSAAADTGPDPAGIWLFPLVRNDNGDCDETRPRRTFHELTYLMDPPDASFAVDSVRVDLIGNGVATSAFGDAGTFSECNSQYVHSFIDMHVSIAQLVDGAWQHLPLSDRLFAGQGEYARQVRLVLSAQTGMVRSSANRELLRRRRPRTGNLR